MSAAARDLGAGEIVAGRYQVAALLGSGGMGSVYRARDRAEERDVALKVVKAGRALTLALRNEFRAMSRLRHPRLVEVYDYGELDGGQPFFTMELLPGRDLTAAAQLPLDDVYRVVASVCDALAFVHARGYVHRDVKPANVRLLPAGGVKLMDLGTAETAGLGRGVVAGTMAYLAPEAHQGAPADPRTDLYALGVVAYELVTGRAPFQAEDPAALLRAKLAPPPALGRAGVPAPFERLIADLLAPEPSARATSAIEVLSRLAELTELPVTVDAQAYLRAPALVGRGAQLGTLRARLAESARDRRRLGVFLVAPAGAGKTRLVEEAMVEARLTGARIAETAARQHTGAPYEVLRKLLAVLVHAPDAERALVEAGGMDALGAAAPTAGTTRAHGHGDAESERLALHGAVGKFLAHLAVRAPLVISIDDIHLCDGATLEALETVLRGEEPAPIALLGTIREGEPRPETLERMMARGERLGLPPLGEAQVTDLMVSTLGRVEPAPELVDDLVRSSEGNAYFLLEILRALVARSAIRRTRTGVELPRRLGPDDVPRSLAVALGARMDRLGDAARRLVRLLALFDRDVELELLGALAGGARDDMLDALDELRGAELVNLTGDHARPHHPRVREVALAGLDAAARADLHRHAALVLEARAADPAELGFHFAESGDRARALRYLVQAGDERFEAHAFWDAGRAYARAEEFVDAAPWVERRRLRRRLCDRLGRIWFLYDMRRAIEYFGRARELHLKSGVIAAIPILSRVLGRMLAGGIAVLLTALGNVILLRPRPLQTAIERVVDSFTAGTYLAACHLYVGSMRDAYAAAERLRPFIYSRKRLPQVAYLAARSAPVQFYGRQTEACRDTEEALRVLEIDTVTPLPRSDRMNATIGVTSTRIWCDFLRGHAGDSKWCASMRRLVAQHPTALTRSWLEDMEISRSALRGELDDAYHRWQRFRDRSRGAELVFVQEKVKLYVGRALVLAGRIGEAADLADQILATGTQTTNPVLVGFARLLRADVLRAWGHQDEAERSLDDAEALFRREDVGAFDWARGLLADRAELALDRGDLEAAARIAAEAERLALLEPLPIDRLRAQARRVLARVALSRGEAAQARAHATVAVELAVTMQTSVEEALARHLLAAAARAGGEATTAAAEAAECERILVHLGNQYQLRVLGYRDASSSTPAPAPGQLTRPSAEALADTMAPADPDLKS